MSLIHCVKVGYLDTNCWIVPLDKGECIIVDPGDEGKKIIAFLAKSQLVPRTVVLTHAHLDHIAALPSLASAFPDINIAVHSAEKEKLGPNSLEIHLRDFNGVGVSTFAKMMWSPMPEPTLLLNDGDDRINPFTIMHVPGHSPGSIALYWQEQSILISGDTLFKAGIGRSDLCDGDAQLLDKSLARLLALPKDTAVYPGHGACTTIGAERG